MLWNLRRNCLRLRNGFFRCQLLLIYIYKIVRENHGQAKERCDFCNYRNGYDFIIYSKAEKKDEVADEWQ